ncbi:MAG: hypothetical protein APF81_00520 [Desulfosporosinus sp. BRH_c37]|nr:MAG: hypothetical protein APF81_00520 [Desulfosporosinus sp. BRH_c37]
MVAGHNDQPGDVIKTFYIPGEEGVSEFWRRNKSPVESLELAHLLDAIMEVSRFIGSNVGNIIWSVMKKPLESNDLVLDSSLVMGKYPVPGNKTDIVLGMAVHEAYRRVEWCEWAKNLAMQKMGKVAPLLLNKFKLYVEMAERIYVDLVANQSVLGLYAEKFRNNRFEIAAKSFDLPPSFDEMLCFWWLIAADGSGCKYKENFSNEMYGFFSDTLEQYYAKPLRLLNSIIPALIEECPKRNSVVDRCEYRANLYFAIWEELYSHTCRWVASEWDLLFLIKKPDIPEEVGVGEKAQKPMTYEMGNEIRAHLKRGKTNLTDVVKIVCNDDDLVPIVVNDIVLPFKENLDKQLLYRLQAAVKSHTEKRNSISRGMKSGKIDARRLYRAPLTGNIFMHKKINYEMTNDIILVVDASGSMGELKWEAIQMVYAALYRVLIGYNQNTRVFAYNDSKGKCDLTDLSKKRGELYTVLPQGKTASGEAIIATAMMLNRKNKCPFIIHITDGASNWGSDVKYAIEHCRKKKIRLMTLGFGCNPNTKVALVKQYGKHVQFIDNLEEFPRKFGDLMAYGKFM